MDRLFCEHKLRKTTLLDGVWKFKTVSTDTPFAAIPADAVDMAVPSCWNLRMGLLDYQGKAWYWRAFATQSEDLLLSFGAVSGIAQVYVDGRLVGSHDGSYTEFSCPVHTAPGEHLLAVLVDNTSDLFTFPKDVADWYRYGGIFRSVELAELQNTRIARHKIDYTLAGNTATVTVETAVVTLHGDAPQTLTVRFDGNTVYSGVYQPQIAFTAEDITRWDTDNPKLYTVEIVVDDDDQIERVGFRTVEAKAGKILLNGRAIKLQGVNRHEDWPEFGHAVPKPLMERDLDLIKDLGCNTVRGAHYPQSRAFLDYLDQNGILFWSEIPLWSAQVESLEGPLLTERGCAMHREMVEQYYHHPSIVMWGLHNEVDTKTDAARELTKAYAATVKAYDTSRPLTFATDKVLEDRCLDLVDIISINRYIGWYGGDKKEWPAFLQQVGDKLARENLSEKPVIMSEFGCAGLYGCHSFDAVRWTEEYQAELLTYELELFDKTPFICGSLVWQFCDIRTSAQGLDRARGFNNKGLVNEHRCPKLAYHAVKRFFSANK